VGSLSESPIDAILRLYDERGARTYSGEAVSQAEHALQCALLAEAEHAKGSLICAALLHDVGHLFAVRELPVAADRDTHHETIGARWLARHFGSAVYQPVRLHVLAKRYLCGADYAYTAALSAASTQSLVVQGGALTAPEQRTFLAQPFAADAVRLRRWDEAAKVTGMRLPAIGSFRSLLERCLAAS
jgi:gamma-butyrobetaine dioxygenase